MKGAIQAYVDVNMFNENFREKSREHLYKENNNTNRMNCSSPISQLFLFLPSEYIVRTPGILTAFPVLNNRLIDLLQAWPFCFLFLSILQ